MTVEVWAMIFAGVAALIAGIFLARGRLRAESGHHKILIFGPVFVAAALAVFAAEHFAAARELMPIVPRWVGFPLFWTYFVGICLMGAALSFTAWRHVRWSASLLALLFLIIVATVDLPGLPRQMHDRFFWILSVREMSFAGGAMVLAGRVGALGPRGTRSLIWVGRSIVAVVMVFYAIEHFLHPDHVPGVPLQKLTPDWMPEPTLIAYFIGITLLLGGIALVIPHTTRRAASFAGGILVLLTALFYVPIAAREIHSALAVEGLNYVFDMLLFAGSVLLAGLQPGEEVGSNIGPGGERNASGDVGIDDFGGYRKRDRFQPRAGFLQTFAVISKGRPPCFQPGEVKETTGFREEWRLVTTDKPFIM